MILEIDKHWGFSVEELEKAREIINFEKEIAEDFKNGLIPYPIHLSEGNEFHLIKIFREILPIDYICTTWRSHIECLLKGVPKKELKQAIYNGHSITLNFPQYRIISSAIVGGIISIANGIALGLKQQQKKERVWCFIGDCTAHTGQFYECHKYAKNFGLNIRYVIADNGKSVTTPTKEVWGGDLDIDSDLIIKYNFQNGYFHSGIKKEVAF